MDAQFRYIGISIEVRTTMEGQEVLSVPWMCHGSSVKVS